MSVPALYEYVGCDIPTTTTGLRPNLVPNRTSSQDWKQVRTVPPSSHNYYPFTNHVIISTLQYTKEYFGVVSTCNKSINNFINKTQQCTLRLYPRRMEGIYNGLVFKCHTIGIIVDDHTLLQNTFHKHFLSVLPTNVVTASCSSLCHPQMDPASSSTPTIAMVPKHKIHPSVPNPQPYPLQPFRHELLGHGR